MQHRGTGHGYRSAAREAKAHNACGAATAAPAEIPKKLLTTPLCFRNLRDAVSVVPRFAANRVSATMIAKRVPVVHA